MKTGKGIGAAVLIAVLLLLGAQLLVRTYFSSRATQILKSSLQDSYGDSITFDALLFNLLSSQADIEHVHLSFPHGTAGGVSTFTAESIIINIPGKDLFTITSPAFDVFSVSRGTVTLRSPVYTHRNPHTGESYYFAAGQLVVDFNSTVPVQFTASTDPGPFPFFLRQFHYVAVEAHQIRAAAPELARLLRDLKHLLSASIPYSRASAAALFETAIPAAFMGLSAHQVLPEFLTEGDRDLAHRIIASSLLLFPENTDVFTSSRMSLRADRAAPAADVYAFQGDITNDAGKFYSSGELHLPEVSMDDQLDLWNALEVRDLYVSIDSLQPEIASLLGSDSFSFSFGR